MLKDLTVNINEGEDNLQGFFFLFKIEKLTHSVASVWTNKTVVFRMILKPTSEVSSMNKEVGVVLAPDSWTWPSDGE